MHGILQARILEWVAFPFSRGSSHPRTEPRSPALQADSLPTELLGKQHRLSQFLKMALNHCFLCTFFFLIKCSLMGNSKKGEHSFLGLLNIWSVCIFKKRKKELMKIRFCYALVLQLCNIMYHRLVTSQSFSRIIHDQSFWIQSYLA